MPKPAPPLRLRAYGVTRALWEAFDDGAWHTIEEAVLKCGDHISPETAARQSGGSDARSLYRGRRDKIAGYLRRAIRRYGGETETGADPPQRRRLRRFKLRHDHRPFRQSARLTEQQVINIKFLLLAGTESQAAIGRRFGVTADRISRIAIGRHYRDVRLDPGVGMPVMEGKQKRTRCARSSADELTRSA